MTPMTFRGTCNRLVFDNWIEKVLVPLQRPGQTIIMDNTAIHKSARTKKLIEDAGCRLLFLPPYSPDYNPIEQYWATVKRKVRELMRQGSHGT
jgi:transposase